jgi:hypothetical protein
VGRNRKFRLYRDFRVFVSSNSADVEAAGEVSMKPGAV